MKPVWNDRREEIEQLLAEGKTTTEIAAGYGVSRSALQSVCSRWKLVIPRREGLPGSKSNRYHVNYTNRHKAQADPFGACVRN